jgi:hypothetical protein
MKLEDIKKLCDEATPGPWRICIDEDDHKAVIDPEGWIIPHRDADAELTAAARQVLPLLVDALLELREAYECVGHYEWSRKVFKALDKQLSEPVPPYHFICVYCDWESSTPGAERHHDCPVLKG